METYLLALILGLLALIIRHTIKGCLEGFASNKQSTTSGDTSDSGNSNAGSCRSGTNDGANGSGNSGDSQSGGTNDDTSQGGSAGAGGWTEGSTVLTMGPTV